MEVKISKEPVGYEWAVKHMEERAQSVRAGKKDELLWFLEHPSLYTAGTSAQESDLIDNMGFPVYKTGRGGQYTYHGPGQRIIYLVLDLKKRGADVRLFVKNLEESIILTLAGLGVKGEIREGRVGVWVSDNKKEEKIAALGIRIRQWVTYHGISVNLNPDLSHYKGIVPCGITEHGVTSLEKLGIKLSAEEFDRRFTKAFHEVFG